MRVDGEDAVYREDALYTANQLRSATVANMLALISLLVTLLIGGTFYLKWKHSYWSRRGVPYMEPEFFYGNFKNASLGKMVPGEVVVKAYYEFKNIGAKYGKWFKNNKLASLENLHLTICNKYQVNSLPIKLQCK